MSDDEMRQLARRFFDAVEAGDIDALVECYAPDAEIWHNVDGEVQTRDQNRETLAAFVRHLDDRRYDDRRVEVFAGGFVHQHVLRATRRDGVRVELPAAIVCRVSDDARIARLDEYFDSAHVARFIAPMG